jgi:DNA-binding transcriptional MocR family regulator
MADPIPDFLRDPSAWPARGALYRRLADALRAAIRRGDLAPGMRLPAERLLAETAGIGRSTVVAAYDLLREDGLVERRQGSGTHVRAGAVSRVSRDREVELSRALQGNVLFRGIIDGSDVGIDFLGAHPKGTALLTPELCAAASEELLGAACGHGYFPGGHPPLRRAVAECFERSGLPTTERQVLITNGAQQALSLTAAFFLQRGDVMVLENPTYAGAIDAANAAGARIVPVPVSFDGARVDVLRELLAGASPKLVYLNPAFHNPTGTVMPDVARDEVAQLVARHQVALVDDRVVADVALEGEPAPPIALHAPEAPILTVGSMSKLFWGGLRVGWLRAPEPIVARITRFKAVLDLGASVPGQIVAAHLLCRIDEVREERRREMSSRLDLMCGLLTELLPSWSWTRPKGGLVLWARLPFGSAREFASLADRRGVAVLPGPVTSPDLGFDDHIRLTYAREPEVLRDGVRRLASAWDGYAPDGARRQGRLEVIV